MFIKEEGVLSADQVQNAVSTLLQSLPYQPTLQIWIFQSAQSYEPVSWNWSLSYISHICVYTYICTHTHTHTHTHTPYWFPFSGELWLIQLLMQEFCKTKNVCKSIGYMEFAINSIVYLKIVSYMPHILNMSNIYYKHIYISMHTLFSQRLRCSLFSSKPKIKVCISFLNQIVSVCEVCYKFRAVWFSCFLKWFSKYFWYEEIKTTLIQYF